MKKIISTIIVSLVMLLMVNSCSKNQINTEKIMNNINTIDMQKGLMTVYELGEITLHAYCTNDMLNDYVFFLEKKNDVLMIEAPAFWDNYSELITYLEERKINVNAVIPSYHPLGASLLNEQALKDAEVSMTQSTVDYFDHGYGAVMKAGIPKMFGRKVDAAFYNPTKLYDEGKIKIAGFNMQFVNSFDGFDILIPEIKTAYVHILGHDTHSEILSYKHLSTSIDHLKKYVAEGYELFLSSHHQPETKANAITKIAYLENMQVIAAESETGNEFIENMNSAYPNYLQGYLLATAAQLFDDYQMPGRQNLDN